MKLHDLRPPEGSHKKKMRVGRGIAAGKGKTAGRGTKGQKARAGGSIPPWFEGGQTPLHIRIPKLRGFKNRGRIEFEVVNVGAIQDLIDRGAFETEAPAAKPAKGAKAKTAASAQITINQDILRAVGLVRTLNKPLKILGSGELTSPLFVVADAFTASARTKVEAAGGIVNVLEVPTAPLPALKGKPAEPKTTSDKPAVEAAPVVDAAVDAAIAEPAVVEAVEAEAETEAPAETLESEATADTEPDPEAEASADAEAPSGDDA